MTQNLIHKPVSLVSPASPKQDPGIESAVSAQQGEGFIGWVAAIGGLLNSFKLDLDSNRVHNPEDNG